MSILNNKWIKYKFEFQNDVDGMDEHEIAIHLQNVIGYLEFLIRHLGFWHNQIYKFSLIYNKNEDQIYNKMHTGKW